jgi:hypothetical protein
MHFENFYEDIGQFDASILAEIKQQILELNLADPELTRPEYCFKNSGLLILPMNYGQVMDMDARYYPYVEPLIELIQATGHYSLRDTRPYRVEISIIQPGTQVTWHNDQHMSHKFSERIHIPIITNDSVEFMSKWFTEPTPYKFKMRMGHIYRYNNRVMHTVKNPADQLRCHVIVDFIHNPVFDYFMDNDLMDQLTSNQPVTPRDEIYYMINRNLPGVEAGELTAEDIRQLRAVANYYREHYKP